MDNVNNITKTGYHSCVSCGVCAAVCPEKAISIVRDNDGFYVPNIDNRLCTGCGMCTKVCYQYLENKEKPVNCFTDKDMYAAWSKNPQIVQSCSSGGIGYELTKCFYNKNYKICGCIFDVANDDCKHIIAASEEDLEAIKTSKYLQSYTVDAFSQFQKDNNYLVIGTPCQIYGLREYIRLKNWENQFILVDFICHGVPSFELWKKWKEYTVKKEHLPQVWKSFNFRYKDGKNYRWHKFTFHVKDLKDKEYFLPSKLFTEVWDYCRNKSCYHCLLRQEDCFSDIRIADFWGEKYDKRNDGVSLVIPNTQRGEEVWNEIKSQ
ncbi:MAG: Coenzyme F420 hydrogenase/dehydrogenase, beta subunit C-terminal domain, partial [Bacteroidales bacterium]|nr:Coenzyme F420 hydrogenase/dehydrogenase, beta subunit C-terminal domain [Bacteroidales bacterium]